MYGRSGEYLKRSVSVGATGHLVEQIAQPLHGRPPRRDAALVHQIFRQTQRHQVAKESGHCQVKCVVDQLGPVEHVYSPGWIHQLSGQRHPVFGVVVYSVKTYNPNFRWNSISSERRVERTRFSAQNILIFFFLPKTYYGTAWGAEKNVYVFLFIYFLIFVFSTRATSSS